jgi:D-3-phosphoglycerate dehydrogenase
MARKLVGFGMHYTAYDPYVPPERMASFGVKPVSLEELLRTSDYVSLHCPLTEETHRLIDGPRLRLMQPHALLVNTSRGQVVDEAALIRALRESWIAGAALDVLAEEPPSPDHPLLHMDNVIITPHASGHADTFPQEFLEASVAAIIAISRGTRPASVVNPFVKPRDARLAVADAAQSPEDRESHL